MPFSRFLRNLALWAIPVIVVWVLITPYYNRFLMRATHNLVRLTESPAKTTLRMHDRHRYLIYHADISGQTSTGHVYSANVTNFHFPLIFLGMMFLAVPGVPLRTRLSALGWALLISVFLHLITSLFWVKFAYSTQLGDWSLQNFGAFARNFWGLGKHLLDLPFKFAAPLILWSAFFLRTLLPPVPATAAKH